MNKAVKYAVPLLALAAASCGQPAPQVPPLEGARLGGPFTLTAENGKRVSDAAFAGQYRIVYFGYTFCPDVCPVDVQRLMQGFKRFEAKDRKRAAKVQPIFVSIDPERDTPEILTVFTDAFHPRLLGLTGTPAELEAVKKAYGVFAEKEDPKATANYKMNHSNTAILYGPKGEPIAPLSQDAGPEKIAAELDQWVK
jgi:protein SCO1